MTSYDMLVLDSDHHNSFAKPMPWSPWIGMYITLASPFCVLAMVADLLHGLRNGKLWFPCKYFTLNIASLSIIAVIMKLLVDLGKPLLVEVDCIPKVGSMAFMCTVMANLLPSLSTTGNKQLLTKIVVLGVLVITLVVSDRNQTETPTTILVQNSRPETFYVAFLLVLLMVYVCSSFAILTSKEILESQYRKVASKDRNLQLMETSTVETLRQRVSDYWIMATTGSPQFTMVFFATTAVSGVICGLSVVLYAYLFLSTIAYKSDYRWSVLVLLFTQFSGVVLGSVAPISRCLAFVSYGLSVKWYCSRINVFKVESYWTETLLDWKHYTLSLPTRRRTFDIVTRNLEVLILDVCIGFQKAFVVGWKMIGLVVMLLMICFVCCRHCWKWLKSMFLGSGSGIELGIGDDQLEQREDLSRHVLLHLQDDMELAEKTLKSLSKCVKRMIQEGEKQQPENLMKLLKSRNFEVVEMLNSRHRRVPPLLAEELVDSWSLPLVTLTTIAVSLPNIPKNVANWLLSSVSEGLSYVKLVEETLNASNENENIREAAEMLWVQVIDHDKWLGTKLKRRRTTSQFDTTGQILRWFRDRVKTIVGEAESSTNIGREVNDSVFTSISAGSMYRITETILRSYHDSIDEVSQEELFELLSWMISDMLTACLANLPRVIAAKCDATAIEKREFCLDAAARLLGETTQIINHVQDHVPYLPV